MTGEAMGSELENKSEAEILEHFKAGAKRYHLGEMLLEPEIQKEGGDMVNAAIHALDAKGPNGRETALTPMLDDPDLHFRVEAASALIWVVPDRVIPLLEDLYAHGPDEVSDAARVTLWVYRRDLQEEQKARERQGEGDASEMDA